MKLELEITLLSDATFGRGDGVAGLVDQEVEYEATTGLPYIRGRTLKGLLVEECANILYALQGTSAHSQLTTAAQFLFGSGGSTLTEEGMLHVGAARLPKPLRETVATDVAAKRITPDDVLASLTDLRRQTAVDEQTNAPDEGSLRTMRVVVRQTVFMSPLTLQSEPCETALALLHACASGLRRGGTGRNRGRGRLKATLTAPKPKTSDSWQQYFCQLVTGGANE